jgi:peptidoglycan-N-acetylglucosamine deacetylase
VDLGPPSDRNGGRQWSGILEWAARFLSEVGADSRRRRIAGKHLGAAALAAALLSGCVLGSPSVLAGSSYALAAGINGWDVGPSGDLHSTGREGDERAAFLPPAVDCLVLRCVALTFDDGPVPDTRRLLGMLSDAGVPATFFDLGERAATYPDLVRAESEQGEVGNHSWSHPVLTQLTDSQVDWQIGRTAAELMGDTGARPTLVRPPFGAANPRVRSVLAAAGAPVILWTVDTLDWLNRDADSVYHRAVDGVRPGSIILMHDIRPTTVSAVPRIIAELAARGYTFVTVSQLFDGDLTPGEVYSGRERDWAVRHSASELSTGPEIVPTTINCRVMFGAGCTD